MSKQRNEINKSSSNHYSKDEINLAYQQCKNEGKETSNGNIEYAANQIRNDWNSGEQNSLSSDTSRPSDNFRDYDDI